MFQYIVPKQPSVTDATVSPSQLRIRPAQLLGEGFDGVVSGAVLVVPHEGGALRTILTGSKKHATGMYPSRKTGRCQYWEGAPERLLVIDSEVDYNVIDYQTQPFRLEFVYDGRRYVYIVDHCRQYRNGSIELIEVKRTPRDIRDPDYRLKLACVHEICRQIGWSFKVLFLHRSVVSPERQRNLELIQSRRFATIDMATMERLFDCKRRCSASMEYGALSVALSPNDAVLGQAFVQSLIARGQLAVDLEMPLNANTQVTFIEPAPSVAASFRI